MPIDPIQEDIDKCVQENPDAPMVMMNLLRFNKDGLNDYMVYSATAQKVVEKVGAQVLYAGFGSSVVVGEPGQTWDGVLLVRYPNRAAFAALMSDPDYASVKHLRTRAVVEAVMQATNPVILPPSM
jgi:uncharacterized protein (DUF1330 family)